MTSQPHFLERPLPSAPDAERLILGAVLVDNALIAQAAESLRPEHFYSPLHRQVYAAMLSLFGKSEKIDPILVGAEMRLLGFEPDSIGGVATITNLTYGLPRFEDISAHVDLVLEKHRLRELVKACGEITQSALDDSEEAEKVLSFAQSRVNEIAADSAAEGFSTAAELAVESLREKLELRAKDSPVTGLQTGFHAIDDLTGGIQPELIILGARPGIGKTSLMVNLADGVCENQSEAVVAIFSLEMSKRQLIDRMICSRARLSAKRYRRGLFTDQEAERLARAAAELSGFRIEIDDTPALSPAQIRAKSIMLKAKAGRLDFVIIDFLQKCSPSRAQKERRLEVGSIARELKDLVKALNVPVLAVSSLSRECEARADKRPVMSDLSESNAIESEADIIAFLYRDHYYNSHANPYEAELDFAKNRNGEEKTIELRWTGEFTRFDNAY